jgi:hypothetical protein
MTTTVYQNNFSVEGGLQNIPENDMKTIVWTENVFIEDVLFYIYPG